MIPLDLAQQPAEAAFPFLAVLAIQIGLFAIQRLLFKPPKVQAQDWTNPTSEEGLSVPVHWGTAEIAPNTVWIGHHERKTEGPIYRYYASMHHVFCFGLVNEVVDYNFDGLSARNFHLTHAARYILGGGGIDIPLVPVMDDALAPEAMALDPLLPIEIDLHGDQERKAIQAGSMFGGNKAGGGIAGTLAFYFGSDSQPVDAYLASAAAYGPTEVSRWPRIAYARMGGTGNFYHGTTATAYPFRAVLRRTHWWEGTTSPLGQTNAQATISYDANPAEILYDILTNQIYGLGRSVSRLDVPSFEAAAVTLRSEFIAPMQQGFGLSVLVNTPKEASTVIRDILDHIDGVLVTDPLTGLLQMRLIRADYDPDTLPVIDETNSRDFKYTPATWANTINQVRITYNRFINNTERRGFVPGIAFAHDDANFQATGNTRTLSINMPYITDPDVAQFVAERERRVRGTPLAKASWSMDRSGYGITPGDVRKVNGSAFGVADLIIRITSVNYGTLSDGRIQVEGVQDVFSVTSPVFDAPGESGFVEEQVTIPVTVDDDLNVIWGEARP